jgi:hypothetical protein
MRARVATTSERGEGRGDDRAQRERRSGTSSLERSEDIAERSEQSTSSEARNPPSGARKANHIERSEGNISSEASSRC